MDWNGKVAIVTGASSGIGLAVARAVVAKGGRVALVARTKAKLDVAVAELSPGRARAIAQSVTDREAMARLPALVKSHFGRIDVLVNNAGVNHRGGLRERTAEELAEILETNLVAPVLLTRACLPEMEAGGVVVNVASLAGKVPVPHEAAYSASKAGLRAFSRAVDHERGETGIRVATVCPGPVDTGFFGDLATVPDLVFSQPMRSAEAIAEAVIRAIETPVAEISVPAMSGALATVGYLFPGVFTALRPLLERRGAANKRRYAARRSSR